MIAGSKMTQDSHDTLFGEHTVGDKTYKIYSYKVSEDSDAAITLYENGGSYYTYDSKTDTVTAYVGTVDKDRLTPVAMSPMDQMNAAFSKDSGVHSAAAGYKPSEEEMGSILEGDGQRQGSKDYSEYGQGGASYDAPDGAELYTLLTEDDLYVLKDGSYVKITDGSLSDTEKQGTQYYKDGDSYKTDYIQHDSGKYLKYVEESASEDQKNRQKYYYDEATQTYVAATTTYSTDDFDETAEGGEGSGTSFDPKPIPGLDDRISAVIGSGSTVTAKNDINVSSSDVLDTLVISGTGDMPDFELNAMPWYAYQSSIKKVIVKEGVTSIGGRAFYDCTNITEVSLPDSLRAIGSYAFKGCESLKEITLPVDLTAIGSFGFVSSYHSE